MPSIPVQQQATSEQQEPLAATWRSSWQAIPLFYAALLFALGICIAQIVDLRPGLLLAGLVASMLTALLAAWRAPRLIGATAAVVWLLLGAWSAELEPQPAPDAAALALADGLTRGVEGTVVANTDPATNTGSAQPELPQPDPAPGDLAPTSDPDEDQEAASASQTGLDNVPNSQDTIPAPRRHLDLELSAGEVVTDDFDRMEPVSGRVRITVVPMPANAGNHGPMPRPFACGERVRAIVRLLPPDTYHDPGVWSRSDFLLAQGITATGSASLARLERIGTAPRGPAAWGSLPLAACQLGRLQHRTSGLLLSLPNRMRALPVWLRVHPDDAALLAAMLAGDRGYLSRRLRAGFERTGSFHMLVVSGLHLAIVAGCVFWLAMRLKRGRGPATIITLICSLGYALFTGFALPVQRSFWMVAIYLLGRLLYRERSPLNAIGFAALCLLVANPRSLLDAGFQMTLLAVVSIAGIAIPLLQQTIRPLLQATRHLDVIGIDRVLAPRAAQFRVTLRLVAEHLEPLIGLERAGRLRRRQARIEQLRKGDKPGFWRLLRQGLASLLGKTPLHLSGGGMRADSDTPENKSSGRALWLVGLVTRMALTACELFAIALVVELAMTLPMTIYFHRIPLYALPVNLLTLPLLTLLIPAALLTLLALAVWPWAALLPGMVTALLIHLSVWMVHFAGRLAMGDLRVPGPLGWQIGLSCGLLAAAVLLAHGGPRAARSSARGMGAFPGPALRLRMALPALLSATLVGILPRSVDLPRDPAGHPALLFEAIDVGQGDSLLLITPDGKSLLVDGGGFGGGFGDRAAAIQNSSGFDIGEEVVSPVLWSHGIRRLDAVALSHAHSDHMGGLPAILRNFRPRELWVGDNPLTPDYRKLLAEAKDLGITVRAFHAGDAWSLGVVQARALAPVASYHPGLAPSNNDSLVLRLGWRGQSVLLEGDAESPVEQAMLAASSQAGLGLRSTLLKVGHHGSLTSTRPDFLAAVAPQWAVISCGRHNHYGHPREEILERLQAAHARTLRTDSDGASCLLLNGATVKADPMCR